jgi:hypothetical protein
MPAKVFRRNSLTKEERLKKRGQPLLPIQNQTLRFEGIGKHDAFDEARFETHIGIARL